MSTVAQVLNTKFDEVRELARKTLYRAVISAGGLLIQDDGAFEIVTSAGVYTLYAKKGLDGKREFGLLRDNGTFVLRTLSTSGSQAWALHDNLNNIVVSDDGVSGQGLARPSLTWPTRRIRFDALPSTDASSFEGLVDTGWVYKSHPRTYVQVVHCATTSGTTGEMRLMLDGVQVGATQTVGFAVTYVDVGPFAVPGTHMSQHRLVLECRRTGGTGRIGADMTIRNEAS
ncbi:hypothetical protein ACVDFE_02070 [Lentzea chajnantorensis]